MLILYMFTCFNNVNLLQIYLFYFFIYWIKFTDFYSKIEIICWLFFINDFVFVVVMFLDLKFPYLNLKSL